MWPSNHKYMTFSLEDFRISVTDNCSNGALTASIIKVSSDAPEDAKGNGDGKTKNDIVIGSDGQSVSLRAERQGGGNGRVYTIYFVATDESGNIGEATCKVVVPHHCCPNVGI